MSTPRTSPAALRTPTLSLIAADFIETRFVWPLVIGISGANLATAALIFAFSGEPLDVGGLVRGVPLNWAIAWAIFLVVARIIEATESTAPNALAGAGLRLQNRVAWTVHLVYAFIAATVWAIARLAIPGSYGLGGRVISDADSGALVPLEALALFLALVALGAIASVIGHAFRVGRVRGGVCAIIVYVVWLFDCGMLLVSASAPSGGGASARAILAIALVIPLASIPLAWVLAERGPIGAVG